MNNELASSAPNGANAEKDVAATDLGTHGYPEHSGNGNTEATSIDKTSPRNLHGWKVSKPPQQSQLG